jgi:hypothetical protein
MSARCTVPGCERPLHSRATGYCNAHQQRWRRTGDPGPAEIAKPGPSHVGCSVAGCERTHSAHGYCKLHDHRRRSHGDAEAPSGPGPRKEVVGYSGAHGRVRAAKGPATGHPCRECGGPAAEWAYTNDDPAELIDGKRQRYSLDVDRYVPMCNPCHDLFDRRETQARAGLDVGRVVDLYRRGVGATTIGRQFGFSPHG